MLPLIIALTFQTLGALWWAAGIDLRVRTIEDKLHAHEDIIERVAKAEEALESLQNKH